MNPVRCVCAYTSRSITKATFLALILCCSAWSGHVMQASDAPAGTDSLETPVSSETLALDSNAESSELMGGKGKGKGKGKGGGSVGDEGLVDHQAVINFEVVRGVRVRDIQRAYDIAFMATEGASRSYQMSVSDPSRVDALLETLREDPRIVWAERAQKATLANAAPFDNYIWGITNPGDLYSQYAFGLLNLDPGSTGVHQISKGKGVTVAVLDTGFNLKHPFLSKAWTSKKTHFDFVDGQSKLADEVVGNGVDEDLDGKIDEAFGHGTFVAGIVHLIAPQAKIMPLRVLNDDGVGSDFHIAQAIWHAVEEGADVINMSLVLNESSWVVQLAVVGARAHGVLVISAAGNAGMGSVSYPSASTCSLSVSSVGETLLKSGFANYGSSVDFVTPGEDIDSAYPLTSGPEGDFEYVRWSGSSMSSPFLAGQAALLYDVLGDPDPSEVGNYIAATAQSVDQQNPEYAGQLGYGLPDILASLQLAESGGSTGVADVLQGCN